MHVGILRVEFAESVDGRDMRNLVLKLRKRFSVAVSGDKNGVLAVSAVMANESALRNMFEQILDACEMYIGRIEHDWVLIEDLDVLHEMDEEEEDAQIDSKRHMSVNFR